MVSPIQIPQFYIINLDRAAERWAHIENQFNKLDLKPIRVSAVDGKLLRPEDTLLYHTGRYRHLRDGEIGCFLSHRKCWQMIVDGDHDYAFVFEDDVYISSKIKDFLKTGLWQNAPGLISVEQFYPDILVRGKIVTGKGGFNVHFVAGENPGTGGYLVSKTFARILLENSDPFYHLVDSFMFSPKRFIASKYGSYQLDPALCLQGRKNQDFAASHHVMPTMIGGSEDLASQSQCQPYGLKGEIQRGWINIKRLLRRFGARKLHIRFEE